MIFEEQLNRFFKSTAAYVIVAVVAFIVAIYEWSYKSVGLNDTPRLTFIVMLLVSIALLLLNRRYQFPVKDSSLNATIYVALSVLIPQLIVGDVTAAAFAMIIVWCTHLLFTIYNNPNDTARIFTVFSILGYATYLTPVAAWIIVPFMIGMRQMHSMKLRCVVAMILGIVTPFWITVPVLAYFGLLDYAFSLWHVPVPVWKAAEIPTYSLGALFIAVVGVVTVIVNFMNLMKAQPRPRAYNGFSLVLMLWAIICPIFDFTNLLNYMPALMLSTAAQIDNAYNSTRAPRRYLPILLLIVASIAGGIILTTT